MRILVSIHIDMGVINMNIKEIYNIIKFIRKSNSCLILRNDLQLGSFGYLDDTMLKFHDEIMKISIKK